MPAFTEQELDTFRRARELGQLTDVHKKAIIVRQREFDAANDIDGGQPADVPDFPPSPDATQEPKQVEGSTIGSAAGGTAKGVAGMIGMPVDLITMALNAVGADIVDPIGGSQQIQEAFAEMGMANPVGVELPNKFAARVGEEIGAAAVALFPFGVVAKYAKDAGPIISSFKTAPKRFTATEISAATGAGAGAALAQEINPDSVLAEMTGQIVGGFANPLTVLQKTTPVAIRSVRKAVKPFSKKEQLREVAAVIQKGADVPVAIKRLGEDTLSPLSPAQKSQNPFLLSLERTLIKSNAELNNNFAETARITNSALQADLRTVAEAAINPQEFMRQRTDYLGALMDRRLDNAFKIADEKLAILGPDVTTATASETVVDQLGKALSDVRKQERELYEAIPQDVKVGTSNTMIQMAEILETRGFTADKKDIPGFVTEFVGRITKGKKGKPDVFKIGKLGKELSVNDYDVFRGRLLAKAAKERAEAAPNRTMIRILNQLQETVIDDIGEIKAVDEAVQIAHDFSRRFNDRFSRGPVGKMLSRDRQRASVIAANEALTKTVGKQKEAGLNAFNQIMEATDNDPETRVAIIDFLKNEFFFRATDRNGKLTRSGTHTYVKNNRELLNKVPELRDAIRTADKAQKTADSVALSTKIRQKGLLDKNKSVAASYLNAPVGREIHGILNARNPVKATKEVVRRLVKDKTGQALQGFKSQWIDEMMGMVQLKKLTTQGVPFMDGNVLGKFIDDNRTALQEAFTGNELFRLDKIANEAKAIHSAQMRGIDITAILDGKKSLLSDLVARGLGAKAGAEVAKITGGQALVLAGGFSRFTRLLANQIPAKKRRALLIEAVQDEKLMKVLLEEITTTAEFKLAEKQLNAFIFNLLPVEAEEE